MEGRWEEIEHTADVAITVEAPDLTSMFATACRGMFELMYGEPRNSPTIQRDVEASGDNPELLLWDWLSTVLSWGEVDRAAYREAEIQLEDGALKAEVRGESIDELELIGPPIKAVTLHDLEVTDDGDRWRATIVFDV